MDIGDSDGAAVGGYKYVLVLVIVDRYMTQLFLYLICGSSGAYDCKAL